MIETALSGKARLIESMIAAAETSVLKAQRPHIDRIDISESMRAWANGEPTEWADPEQLATAVVASLQGGLPLAKRTWSSAPVSVVFDSVLAYVGTFRVVRPSRIGPCTTTHFDHPGRVVERG